MWILKCYQKRFTGNYVLLIKVGDFDRLSKLISLGPVVYWQIVNNSFMHWALRHMHLWQTSVELLLVLNDGLIYCCKHPQSTSNTASWHTKVNTLNQISDSPTWQRLTYTAYVIMWTNSERTQWRKDDKYHAHW